MQKQPRHRLITSNGSAETLAYSPTLNNHTINRSFSWSLLSALMCLLMLTGSNCFAESDYKDMGDAFDFFDKLEAEESIKQQEPVEKPVQKTAKPEPVKTIKEKKTAKPAIEGLDSILSEITSTPSVDKTKPAKKTVVKTPPRIKKTRAVRTAKKAGAPVKKNDFQKRDMTGKKLNTEAEQWSCVEDATNKLVWEMKTSNGEKRDKNHTYSWYSPELDNTAGTANGGRCKGGVPCDTHAYVQAINEQKLCGYSDWRLPTREEMLSLIGQKKSKDDATIDQKFFPDAMPSWYWTASANEEHPEYAWYVLFRNGISLNDLKERPKHIRLVRGGEHKFAAAD